MTKCITLRASVYSGLNRSCPSRRGIKRSRERKQLVPVAKSSSFSRTPSLPSWLAKSVILSFIYSTDSVSCDEAGDPDFIPVPKFFGALSICIRIPVLNAPVGFVLLKVNPRPCCLLSVGSEVWWTDS